MNHNSAQKNNSTGATAVSLYGTDSDAVRHSLERLALEHVREAADWLRSRLDRIAQKSPVEAERLQYAEMRLVEDDYVPMREFIEAHIGQVHLPDYNDLVQAASYQFSKLNNPIEASLALGANHGAAGGLPEQLAHTHRVIADYCQAVRQQFDYEIDLSVQFHADGIMVLASTPVSEHEPTAFLPYPFEQADIDAAVRQVAAEAETLWKEFEEEGE